MEQQSRTREMAIGTVSGMAERKLQEARDNQNLSLGVGGGIAAAVVGAIIWAIITVVTGYQIGWMAVGVGFWSATRCGCLEKERIPFSAWRARPSPWPAVSPGIC